MIRSVQRYTRVSGWLICFMCLPVFSQEETAGVVIEKLDEDAALYQAGVRVGDRITHWKRLPNTANPEAAQGHIADYFDWWVLIHIQSPQGTVKLFGERDGEPHQFEVPIDRWKAKVRPELSDEMLEVYRIGKQRIEAGEIKGGVKDWEDMAQETATCWIWLQIGDAWQNVQKLDNAQTAYRQALANARHDHQKAVILKTIGDIFKKRGNWEQALSTYQKAIGFWRNLEDGDLGRAYILNVMGIVAFNRGNLAEAERRFQQVLAIKEQRAPNSLNMAATLNNLGVVAEARGDLEESERHYQRVLIVQQQKAPNSLGMAGTLSNLGIVAMTRGDLEEAERLYQQALIIRKEKAPNSLLLSGILNNLGNVAKARGGFAVAERRFQQALSIEEKIAPNSLNMAVTLNNMASLARDRGDLAEAERGYQRSLFIKKQKAPNSLNLAGTLNNLGILAHKRGNLEEAKRRFQQALAIEEKQAPNSLRLTYTLSNLAVVEHKRGNLAAAERRYQQNLVILQKRVPNSLELAATLNNLGVLARERGNLAEAERRQQEALAIREKKAPNSLNLADTWNNLGIVSRVQGDLAEARRCFQKALAIKKQLAPNSLNLASTLINLGIVARMRGDLSEAERLYRQALSIQKQKAPDSIELAYTFTNLGIVVKNRGDLVEAERRFQQALAIRGKIPNSLSYAKVLTNLGVVARERGDLAAAERRQQEALVIREKKASNNLDLALTLSELAKIYREMEQLDRAQHFFERSLDVLDAQFESLGGSHLIKTGFLTQNRDYYRVYLGFLTEQQDFRRAFEILERSRAKVLRDMIVERDLVLCGEHLPLALDAERQRLAYVYERTQADLSSNPEKEKELLEELHEYRRQYDEIKRQIRALSPELASLRFPQAKNLAEIQDMLDPETLLLAYSVMEGQTVLFVVQNSAELKVVTIPKGNQYFQEKINRWRQLTPDQKVSKVGQTMFDDTGFKLAQLLIKPAQTDIANAQRLIVIPDGPLWYWPFGGMIMSKDDEPRRYLIEEKPISTVVSASLYAELKERPKRQTTRVAAMGDAVYPAEKATTKSVLQQRKGVAPSTGGAPGSPTPGEAGIFEPSLRSLPGKRSINHFGRIPHTALEVQSIADIYGTTARTYLREEANEANFNSFGEEIDILHIAGHGVVDNLNPLDSALLLTINDNFQEGEESGVVYAWEIFESMRLQADLVVLSACESGLGQTSGGEGLIGLTRAFQFAGARSIIASYWKVEDQSTSALMSQFYRHLKAGKPKDEALRQAQIEMIHQPIQTKTSHFFGLFEKTAERDVSHPYYWAAFQLIGPWD